MTYTPEQIRAMLDAATRGPWWWRVRTSKGYGAQLIGGRNDIVLDFVRRGMSSAIVRFNIGGLMYKADEISIPRKGQEHNASWNSTLVHPDAVLIQEGPTIIGDLLADNEKKDAQIMRLRGLVGVAYSEGYSAALYNERGEAKETPKAWSTSEARKALDPTP